VVIYRRRRATKEPDSDLFMIVCILEIVAPTGQQPYYQIVAPIGNRQHLLNATPSTKHGNKQLTGDE